LTEKVSEWYAWNVKTHLALLTASWIFAHHLEGIAQAAAEHSPEQQQTGRASSLPMGQPGQRARYRSAQQAVAGKSTVVEFTLGFGAIESGLEQPHQWVQLAATKANGERFRIWLLSAGYPPRSVQEAKKTTAQYILQEGASRAVEFRDRVTQQAILPALGAWFDLIPRMDPDAGVGPKEGFASTVRYLGQRYRLAEVENGGIAAPPEDLRIIELLPDVLVGVASNTRQKDERRRYDNSDYELVSLTREDYRQMLDAGMNCFKVDAGQLPWVQELDAFYWGLSGAELPCPECLYRSTYLGPTLFLDEPAVGTRDYVLQPKLEKEPTFKKTISPQMAFEAFQVHFQHALQEGAPQVLLNSLRSRTDVDLGTMEFKQENLFSWETMVSTAAYELSQDPKVPAAMVFEPPGRVGTLRTLPELDMTYGCQLPVDDPKNLTDIIYGFLRGAARLTSKSWGTSIYGAVDRADAFWFLTHAYDLGATRFFFWDNARSACVPYHECLELARDLQAHAANYPTRDLIKLNHGAEVAILLPPGYNLGHVHLGKGSLWGLGELNLERMNRQGVKYRVVMSNFFSEIERCLRLGVAFDLLWDLPDSRLTGYQEAIHVLEDGRLRVVSSDGESLLDHPRQPVRSTGNAPTLHLELSATRGKAPLQVVARAEVNETSAPVYYTLGADNQGVFHNAYVAWEIYGPNEEDYRFLTPEGLHPRIVSQAQQIEVTTSFVLNRPGTYRLRAATVDVAGRSTVAWNSIVVSE
jgi:hypothetical protein